MLGSRDPVDLHVSLNGRSDLSGQIYRQVRSAVLDGRLRQGELLPPSRELARRLAVGRNTVTMAYDRLAAEGFVAGRVGAGTYVIGEPHPSTTLAAAPCGPLRPREIWEQLPDPPDLDATCRYDFRTGMPDARLFPYQRWRALISRELRPSAIGAGIYGDPAGHPGLRAAIARHVGLARAVRATADDVIVTNGTQQAMFLLARVLLEPGSTVAVEDPGYIPPRDVLSSLGVHVAGVPVDAEGLVVDAIPSAARMVYVTPSHQYPLGMPMTLSRRMALLRWAVRCGGVIVEDDYDSEFRFGGRGIEPLQSLDRSGRVCYVGSFSKVMLPTLRLGFVIAPPELRSALRKAKYVTDWHTALPSQAALARFIDEGALSAHVRRMRHVYRERHELITNTLNGELRPWLTPIQSAAGLHVSALATSHTVADLFQITEQLRGAEMAIHPLSMFEVGPQRLAGLIIGYGMISAADIVPGLALLRDTLRQHDENRLGDPLV
jgi:GntR family transcriptional regulator / MocR family aminotransferase